MLTASAARYCIFWLAQLLRHLLDNSPNDMFYQSLCFYGRIRFEALENPIPLMAPVGMFLIWPQVFRVQDFSFDQFLTSIHEHPNTQQPIEDSRWCGHGARQNGRDHAGQWSFPHFGFPSSTTKLLHDLEKRPRPPLSRSLGKRLMPLGRPPQAPLL